MEEDNNTTILVTDSRLTDQEKLMNPDHNLSKLLNSTRNLINMTTTDLFRNKTDEWDNPCRVPNWSLEGLLQPCASLNGYTKLDNAFGNDQFEKRLNVEVLEKEGLETVLESFLKTIKNSELYDEMVANLEDQHWIL